MDLLINYNDYTLQCQLEPTVAMTGVKVMRFRKLNTRISRMIKNVIICQHSAT